MWSSLSAPFSDPDGDGTFDKSITGNYNGAWNVYSALPSGYVLVSDMRSGLFVFQITSPPPTYTVTVTANGKGEVLISPPGNTCRAATCQEQYLQSAWSQVTLTATPDSGQCFNGWAGDCTGTDPTCTLQTGGNYNATGTFKKKCGGGGGGGSNKGGGGGNKGGGKGKPK